MKIDNKLKALFHLGAKLTVVNHIRPYAGGEWVVEKVRDNGVWLSAPPPLSWHPFPLPELVHFDGPSIVTYMGGGRELVTYTFKDTP